MARKQNQIFKGFGSGAGVAAGTTPAKITTQVKVATTTPAPKASNPFQATNTASNNPYVTQQSSAVGNAFGATDVRAAGADTTGGGRTCQRNNQCPQGKVCIDGKCVDTTPDGGGRSCTSNAQCGNGKVCVNYQCVTPGSTTPTPTPTDPCAGVTCPPGTNCVGQPGGGHTCVSVGVPTPPIDNGGGTPPPTNVCSAANPQGSCPPGQLCNNGVCQNLPANNVTPGDSSDYPEEYYRYLVGRGGLHMNSSNALGAFIADQYKDVYDDWQAARMQNENLNWKDFLTQTFGAEQMLADYMRRKFLGSSAAQQGFNPSQYGSGPARWSVF